MQRRCDETQHRHCGDGERYFFQQEFLPRFLLSPASCQIAARRVGVSYPLGSSRPARPGHASTHLAFGPWRMGPYGMARPTDRFSRHRVGRIGRCRLRLVRAPRCTPF
jgi:hypothetical protein